MAPTSPREWLYELAGRSDIIRRFIQINNTTFDSDRGCQPPDIMTSAALVGIIYLLVEQNAATEKAYQRYMEIHFNPTIIINDEWRTIERNVIQSSSNIRFRDFLRSLWRRLQRPWWA